MAKETKKSYSCLLSVEDIELIKLTALETNQSQASFLSKAIRAHVGTTSVETSGQHVVIEELKSQLLEKDKLINKLVSNQTDLIRQNDQSQQLIGAFSQLGERLKLLDKPEKENHKIAVPKKETAIKTNKNKGKSKKKK